MAVELRNTIPQDYKVLSEAIDLEWKFSTYTKESGLLIAEYYLVQCLNGANHAITATVDGEPKGILVLKGMGPSSIDVSVRRKELEEVLSDNPSFKIFLKADHELEEMYGRFVKEYKSSDLAELSLLILCKDAKGYGLGRTLIEEAKRLVTEAGKKGIFFYSDTDCNYGFYDHMGAERIGSGSMSYAGEPLTMYVYRLMFS